MRSSRLTSILFISLLAGLLFLAVRPTPAGAGTLIALESFDPPALSPAPINNQGTQLGWAAPWTGSSGQQIVALPDGRQLFYDIPDGGRVSPSFQALEITGSSNALAARPLAGSHTGTVYIGFLFRFDAGQVNNNDFATFCFNSAPYCDYVNIPTIGLKANMGAGNLDFMVRNTTGSHAYSTDMVIGQTYYLVGRLSKSGGDPAAPYDRFELWVNPAYGDQAAPDAVSTGVSDIVAVDYLALRTANNRSDTYYVDSLVLGTSWEDVVPPAAPTAIGLAALSTGAADAWPALLLAGIAIVVVILSFRIIRPDFMDTERRTWQTDAPGEVDSGD